MALRSKGQPRQQEDTTAVIDRPMALKVGLTGGGTPTVACGAPTRQPTHRPHEAEGHETRARQPHQQGRRAAATAADGARTHLQLTLTPLKNATPRLVQAARIPPLATPPYRHAVIGRQDAGRRPRRIQS
jgi:hypothetical protein